VCLLCEREIRFLLIKKKKKLMGPYKNRVFIKLLNTHPIFIVSVWDNKGRAGAGPAGRSSDAAGRNG